MERTVATRAVAGRHELQLLWIYVENTLSPATATMILLLQIFVKKKLKKYSVMVNIFFRFEYHLSTASMPFDINFLSDLYNGTLEIPRFNFVKSNTDLNP